MPAKKTAAKKTDDTQAPEQPPAAAPKKSAPVSLLPGSTFASRRAARVNARG